jgi:hypothetical protein
MDIKVRIPDCRNQPGLLKIRVRWGSTKFLKKRVGILAENLPDTLKV